jgi:hypothetical protein
VVGNGKNLPVVRGHPAVIRTDDEDDNNGQLTSTPPAPHQRNSTPSQIIEPYRRRPEHAVIHMARVR